MKARRAWARPLVPLYAAGLAVKDCLRAAGVLRTRRLEWPVVSVGSLSAGGAGKTPVVIALAELLQARGWNVDVLSRGYGRSGKGVEQVDPHANDAGSRYGDEPLLIARRAGVDVWLGADRFAAGVAAEKREKRREQEQNAGVLRCAQNDTLKGGNESSEGDWHGRRRRGVHLLDDGFQHRGLERAMDVVLVTEEDLWDALLPAGNLREPLRALGRADVVVLREDEREHVEPLVRKRMRAAAALWTVRRSLRFGARDGTGGTPHQTAGDSEGVVRNGSQRAQRRRESTEFAAGVRTVAFCAIARPEGFWRMLRAAACDIVETATFKDHHRYTQEDVERLVDTANKCGATGFVTTEKDVVKLTAAMRARLETVGPLRVAELDVTFVDEAAVLRDLEARLK